MITAKTSTFLRPSIINRLSKGISIINRCKTTFRKSQDHGINIFDKAHTERLKYKQKDKFFEQELQNPVTKADKDMLREFLQDGKKIRGPADLEDPDKTLK